MNQRDLNGWTPLHCAAYSGTIETATALIRHGADVSAVNDEGCTPLQIAAQSGREGMVQVMVEGGGAEVGEGEG